MAKTRVNLKEVSIPNLKLIIAWGTEGIEGQEEGSPEREANVRRINKVQKELAARTKKKK
jgi:hypothetical protein